MICNNKFKKRGIDSSNDEAIVNKLQLKYFNFKKTNNSVKPSLKSDIKLINLYKQSKYEDMIQQ